MPKADEQLRIFEEHKTSPHVAIGAHQEPTSLGPGPMGRIAPQALAEAYGIFLVDGQKLT